MVKFIKLFHQNYLIILNNLNFLNINLILFLLLIIYNFICGLNYYGLLSFLISLIISFYVFYCYTYSQIFKTFLKFSVVFIISLFIISSLIVKFELISLDILDTGTSKMFGGDSTITSTSTSTSTNVITPIDSSTSANNCPSTSTKTIGNISTSNNSNKDVVTITIDKDSLKNTLNVMGQAVQVSAEKIIPNIGAGAAAGAIGSAVVKASSGVAPVQRLGAIAASTLAGAAAAKVGLGIGANILSNLDIKASVQQSPHSNPDPTRIPSPDIHPFLSFNNQAGTNVHLLEVSPLEELIRYSYLLNILMLIVLISMTILLFNRYILQGNFKFLSYILDKVLPIKYSAMLKGKLEKGQNYNDKFILFMAILNIILMVVLILMDLIISAELVVNIDSYVDVYNLVHGK